jgi:hypothetical protein
LNVHEEPQDPDQLGLLVSLEANFVIKDTYFKMLGGAALAIGGEQGSFFQLCLSMPTFIENAFGLNGLRVGNLTGSLCFSPVAYSHILRRPSQLSSEHAMSSSVFMCTIVAIVRRRHLFDRPCSHHMLCSMCV